MKCRNLGSGFRTRWPSGDREIGLSLYITVCLFKKFVHVQDSVSALQLRNRFYSWYLGSYFFVYVKILTQNQYIGLKQAKGQ